MFSPQQDIELGKRAAADAKKQLPSCNDPKADAYLTELGMHLASKLPTNGVKYPFEFHCVNDKAINAFALPGGYVFVNRGAIEAADNEGQLAAVMAHELSHVALRHGTNQVTKAEWAQGIFSIASGIFGDSTGGSLLTQLGAFAAGGVLLRKINSNIGSLSVNAFSPVIPIVVVLSGLMLWRPRWFALKTVPLAYAAEPLLRPVLAVLWLMPVLGWFADDSGVIVPAAALPLALPLGIAALAAVAYRYRSSQGSEQEGPSAVPAIADSCRPVPAHDLAAEGDRRGEHPGVGWRDPGR